MQENLLIGVIICLCIILILLTGQYILAILALAGLSVASSYAASGKSIKLGGNNLPSIRMVIHTPSAGMLMDGDLVKHILKSRGYDIEIVIHDKKNNQKNREVDLQFYEEHYLEGYPAKQSFMFIHHEFLYDRDVEALRKYPNLIAIAKTHTAEELLTKLVGANKVIYTSWMTSHIQFLLDEKVDPKLVVHLAGTSPFKGTLEVIKAWQKANTKDHYLLILHRPDRITYLDNSIEYWDSLNKDSISDGEPISKLGIDNLERVGNMYLCKTNVSKSTLDLLINIASIHLCPSIVEGWGHIIGQALASGKVAITTDAPPMNELVNNNTGLLVKPASSETMISYCNRIKNKYFQDEIPVKVYKPDIGDLALCIEKAINMTMEQRIELGNKALAFYKANSDIFINRLLNIVDTSLKKYVKSN